MICKTAKTSVRSGKIIEKALLITDPLTEEIKGVFTADDIEIRLSVSILNDQTALFAFIRYHADHGIVIFPGQHYRSLTVREII